MKPVEIFHIGPQKSGTTWLYKAFNEHPEIACPPRDSIHFMDMMYHRGRGWYEEFFRDATPEQKLFDPTYSYIRCPLAPARIHRENPSAKILLTLRHPVDRAFSHYWHEKKKECYTYEFSDYSRNYDLYASWIETGFYARHLERYLQVFNREQILVQRFELLESNPREYLREALEFVGVDSNFTPTVEGKKVNEAGFKRDSWSWVRSVVDRAARRIVPGAWKSLGLEQKFSGREEYKRGPLPEVRAALLELYEPETAKLEELLDIDFSAWRE